MGLKGVINVSPLTPFNSLQGVVVVAMAIEPCNVVFAGLQ